MNEFEAHESSYDHQHKKVDQFLFSFHFPHIINQVKLTHPAQRLKEMARMQRDPLAATKARERERRDEAKSGIGGLSFKPVSLSSGAGGSSSNSGSGALGGGFKKGGFKSAFGPAKAEVAISVPQQNMTSAVVKNEEDGDDEKVRRVRERDGVESETDDDDYYDPKRPTGCGASCGRVR
jgi:hypothetical protein